VDSSRIGQRATGDARRRLKAADYWWLIGWVRWPSRGF